MPVSVSRFAILLIINVGFLCVLGFYGTGTAQQPHPGLVNSAAQRLEMIEQLKQLNRQVAEQNQMLRSGQLSVTIIETGDR